jgi:hypothetical protein
MNVRQKVLHVLAGVPALHALSAEHLTALMTYYIHAPLAKSARLDS